MKRMMQVLALTILTATVAFAAPKPVITVDGVAAAAKLQPAKRAAISQHIVALNAKLEKMRDVKTDEDLRALHEQCLAIHDMIVKQLNDDERQAFYAYLHAQMAAAGIDVHKFAGHHEHHQ